MQQQEIKKRSDRLINYLLISFFIGSILLTFYYDTWFIGIEVGSLLLTAYYSNWKMHIPILIVVGLHHALLGYLQDIGYTQVYFSQLNYFDLSTFTIHISIAAIIFFICGLWAYHLKKGNELQLIQAAREMGPA